MADNVKATWKFLRGKGLTPAQAAGVIGSMQGESGAGLDPAAENPGPDHALGIAQWLGGRKNAAVQSRRLGPQLNHLWHELQTSESKALRSIKAARNVQEAAIAWQRDFERGAPFEQKYNLRVSNARKVLQRMHGVTGADATPRTGGGARATAASAGTPGTPGMTRTTVTPGVDNRSQRAALALSFLEDRKADPLNFALQMREAQDVPETSSTETTPGTPGVPGTPGTRAPGGAGGAGGTGSEAALKWAESKLGTHETGGANRGRLPDYLNQRFGFGAGGGQPWCAMFTSAAVTKGGAPLAARTASVAGVHQKAQAGVGYKRGYVPPNQARPGDLVLFGSSHIGLVKSASGGKVTYVGGNQSDAVTEATTNAGGNVKIVRPKYGAR